MAGPTPSSKVTMELSPTWVVTLSVPILTTSTSYRRYRA